MPNTYTEDQLCEQPAIQLFTMLGWKTVSAMKEVFGPGVAMARETKSEVVLGPRLHAALERLNPGLPRLLSGAVDLCDTETDMTQGEV